MTPSQVLAALTVRAETSEERLDRLEADAKDARDRLGRLEGAAPRGGLSAALEDAIRARPDLTIYALAVVAGVALLVVLAGAPAATALVSAVGTAGGEILHGETHGPDAPSRPSAAPAGDAP